MHSALPVERFERILETLSHEEMAKLLVLLEQNLSEKEVLRILVNEFDLESKGFNSLGYPYNEALPTDWDWIMPDLQSAYDIYKHFPVITDRIEGMQEAYSIMWHNKKYEARFEESDELPEEFHIMMHDRLMEALKASSAWILKAARTPNEICYVVKAGTETEIHEVTDILHAAKPSKMDMAMAALATLKTNMPLIYNKKCENTITVDVYIKELLARKANIEKVRSEMQSKLAAHSIWTMQSLGERKGFLLTLV